jgi:hypothetical protein
MRSALVAFMASNRAAKDGDPGNAPGPSP